MPAEKSRNSLPSTSSTMTPVRAWRPWDRNGVGRRNIARVSVEYATGVRTWQSGLDVGTSNRSKSIGGHVVFLRKTAARVVRRSFCQPAGAVGLNWNSAGGRPGKREASRRKRLGRTMQGASLESARREIRSPRQAPPLEWMGREIAPDQVARNPWLRTGSAASNEGVRLA